MAIYRVPNPCDECDVPEGVKAETTVKMPSGRLLSFCDHHMREHSFALLAQGATVVDPDATEPVGTLEDA